MKKEGGNSEGAAQPDLGRSIKKKHERRSKKNYLGGEGNRGNKHPTPPNTSGVGEEDKE